MFGDNFNSKYKEKVCVICGKKFCTRLPSQKTCSPECSMENKMNYSKILNENNKRYYGPARKLKKKTK